MEEAVLDTNLSSANESQIPQPECYSWQLAQVVYMKDRPRSKARGVLQGMFFFFFFSETTTVVKYSVFLLCYPYTSGLPALDLVILIQLVKIRVLCPAAEKSLILSYGEQKTMETSQR